MLREDRGHQRAAPESAEVTGQAHADTSVERDANQNSSEHKRRGSTPHGDTMFPR